MNKNTASALLASVVAIIVAIALAAAAIINSIPQRIECGACGAHTIDYWHVSNMDNSALVEVCEPCYYTIMENEGLNEADHI